MVLVPPPRLFSGEQNEQAIITSYLHVKTYSQRSAGMTSEFSAITNCPYANNQSKWTGKCIITNLVRCLGNIGDSCFARDPFRSLFTQPVPKYPSCLYFRLNREDECSNSTTKHVIRPGNAATLRRWKLLAG